MASSTPGKKNVIVILNGISLRKKFFYQSIFPSLSKICNVEVFETLTKNDGINLASKAANQYPDIIFAVGGDGTLNQVVNGVLTGRENESRLPTIGIIPIGSGNDFARTAGIKADAKRIEQLILNFSPRKIDVGKISFTSSDPLEQSTKERYFINVADMGMGPMVVDKVLNSGRAFGHGLAYYKSILSTFIHYKMMNVKAVTKDWQWEGKLRTLGIANGKCYGHGLYIAPDAILDDRIFNVFICGKVSVFDFIRFTGSLKKGKHIRIPEIHYKEATGIDLTSESVCMIEGDGEILGQLPARVELIDRRLDFLM